MLAALFHVIDKKGIVNEGRLPVTVTSEFGVLESYTRMKPAAPAAFALFSFVVNAQKPGPEVGS
jgi:hypothetical protein